MSIMNSWNKKHSVPGSIKSVYGAKYPPLTVDPTYAQCPQLNHATPSARQSCDGEEVGGGTNARFSTYEASVSDAWSLDDDQGGQRGDSLINAFAAQSAAEAVLSRHHQELAEGPMQDGGDWSRNLTFKDSRAKTHGMQLLATQKEPIPGSVNDCANKTPSPVTIYPKLPTFNNAVAPSPKKTNFPETQPSSENLRFQKINRLLSDSTSLDLAVLRKECWKGIPAKLRPDAWRLLSGYIPLKIERRSETLHNKREEYFNYVEQYFHTRFDEQHQDTFRQIHIDIPRMCPLIPLFQQKLVQEIFERILYICAIRHPASGYVQGINDLVTPFFVVFLSEYINEDTDIGTFDVNQLPTDHLHVVEADSFWCVTRLIDTIQDNYTFAQPGVQRRIQQLQQLVERVDNALHEHLVRNQVEYLQFAFRWMNNLLMREIPLRATIRLWDTYLSEPEGFAVFHVYVCAAFLRIWSRQIQTQKDFQNVMLFIQNLPTNGWTDQQISELTADAFSLMSVFSGTRTK